MKPINLALPKFASVLILALMGLSSSHAQVSEKKFLSSDNAETLLSTCLAFAKKNNLNLSIAVVDDGGRLLSYHRMGNRNYSIGDHAVEKATSALESGGPTMAIQKRFEAGANTALAMRQIPFGGGLPIYSGAQLIGAIGVGGSPTRDLDEQCAQSAIDAVAGTTSAAPPRPVTPPSVPGASAKP